MVSKSFFTRTRIVTLILLSAFSLLAVSSVYLTIYMGMEKKFVAYKKEYFIEQAHNMSFFISEQTDSTLNILENDKMYIRLEQEFSIPIDIYTQGMDFPIYTSKSSITEKNEIMTIDVPIILSGVKRGYLKAYYDMEKQIISPGLTKYENDIKNFVFLFTIILFIILLILSFVVSRFIAKPVEQAAKVVDKVIKGNRDVYIPHGGTTESQILINGVNSLLNEFKNMENWRKQMMEDLAHELRTPLTSVLAIMEAMIDGIYPTNTKYLQEMYDEVDRLSRLLINVENLSEAEGARFKLNVEAVNLITTIKGTYDGFLYIAQQKEIDFHFKHPNKPCVVEVDPDRLIQVITNIISNALKYTPARGRVEIGIDFNDNAEEVEFYCQDNGIGISEEDQELVFNRFYRVEKSRSRESGGSGIGLNVSKALAQAQGWDIGVTSELDKGSRFWVRIPLKK